MNQADDEQVSDQAVDQHDAPNDEVVSETPQPDQDAPVQDDDEAEVVITLGDDSPPSSEEEAPQAAPEWVKKLRREARETARENRELKAKLAEQVKPVQEQALPKPTLADCDYDEEIFETKLDAWKEQQRSVKAKQEAEAEQQRKRQEEWEAKKGAYDSAKASLKVSGFDEAEETLKANFSELQQAVMLDAIESADMQAKLVYALGNSEAELKRLSSITNPIKFAIAVAALEQKLKVTPRKAPPAPEKTLSGRSTATGVTDNKLAALEAEAERTGDYSKVFAHKREMRRKEQV